MKTEFGRLGSMIIMASMAVLTAFPCASKADGGYFSASTTPSNTGWPYVAPAQNFPSSTTTLLNLGNPGFNPNYLSSPLLYNSNSYGSSSYSSSGVPLGSTIGSYALRAATSQIPYVGGYLGGIGGWGSGLGGWGGSYGGWGSGLGSLGGLNGLGGWSHGWGSWSGIGNYGGYGGYNGYSAWNPSGYGYGGFGYGGFGYNGNRATMSGGPNGTTPNRIIQTGPSPSSGNYYNPATPDPTASGGYYASGSSSITQYAPAPPKTKNQPTTYYGSSDSESWGGGGNPFPKDLNSVPWSK